MIDQETTAFGKMIVILALKKRGHPMPRKRGTQRCTRNVRRQRRWEL